MRPRILIILTMTLVLATATQARDERQNLINTWQQRMSDTESALKSADYREAIRLANKTISEMTERLGTGERSTQLFCTALTQKALAHAGLVRRLSRERRQRGDPAAEAGQAAPAEASARCALFRRERRSGRGGHRHQRRQRA